MFIQRYHQATLVLMEAAVELDSAEDDLRHAEENSYDKVEKNTMQGRIDEAKHDLEDAARKYAVECQNISP